MDPPAARAIAPHPNTSESTAATHQLVRGQLPMQDARPQVGVGGVFEVEREGAQLGLVVGVDTA